MTREMKTWLIAATIALTAAPALGATDKSCLTGNDPVVSDDAVYVTSDFNLFAEEGAGLVDARGVDEDQLGVEVRKQLPDGAYLELFVKVDKDWQRRPKALERLGY